MEQCKLLIGSGFKLFFHKLTDNYLRCIEGNLKFVPSDFKHLNPKAETICRKSLHNENQQ